MKYRAVIFDLDDTLLKTAEPKWRHHKAVAKRFYDIDLTDEMLAEHWGKPFDVMIGHLYNHADTVENMRNHNRSIEAEFPKAAQEHTLQAIEMLRAAGSLLGVVTSTNTLYAENDLERLGIGADAFLFIQGADKSRYHKPDRRVFDPALELLAREGIAKEQAVYVGDDLIDYRAADAAGIHFIGIPTGFTSAHQFREAGAEVVATLESAANYILKPPHRNQMHVRHP